MQAPPYISAFNLFCDLPDKVDAIVKSAEHEPIIFTQESQSGQKYEIDFELVTDRGASKVRSA